MGHRQDTGVQQGDQAPSVPPAMQQGSHIWVYLTWPDSTLPASSPEPSPFEGRDVTCERQLEHSYLT